MRERGGKVKTHVVPLHGTVRMVDHAGGFGFVETAQGEVYFHRNSVIEAEFDAIEPGSKVRLEVAERESADWALPGHHGAPHRQAPPAGSDLLICCCTQERATFGWVARAPRLSRHAGFPPRPLFSDCATQW